MLDSTNNSFYGNIIFNENHKLMNEIQHPITVEFKPSVVVDPLKERRQYLKELSEAKLALRRLEKELQVTAYTDELSGLYNQALFSEKMPQLFNLAKNNGIPLALILLDVDGLKRTNDSVGHWQGDELLKAVGTVLKQEFRDEDKVGRLGGDEFYAILLGYQPMPGKTIEEHNIEQEKRIKSGFNIAVQEAGIPPELNVGISLGIAVLQPSDSLETFMERADYGLRSKKDNLYKSLREQGIVFEDTRLSAGNQA
jgi:diguanylate cyclase (GGDEF)-like protein